MNIPYNNPNPRPQLIRYRQNLQGVWPQAVEALILLNRLSHDKLSEAIARVITAGDALASKPLQP